jgi:Ni,Fe-hydrogenase maturation factor
MPKSLVLGYGNPDREDDGVAWHVLQKIAAHYNCPITSVDDLDPLQIQEKEAEANQDIQMSSHFRTPISLQTELQDEASSPPPCVSSSLPPRVLASPHLAFALQLTPEMAEPVAHHERVCFVDAHTGAYPEEIRITHVTSGYQASPFTHHLTPESCLALAQTLYGHAPEGLLVSIRGYRFGYGTELSGQTATLTGIAAEEIIKWIVSPP